MICGVLSCNTHQVSSRGPALLPYIHHNHENRGGGGGHPSGLDGDYPNPH